MSRVRLFALRACAWLFVTLSIARALESWNDPGTVMRISARCARRCAVCLHARASMLSDIARSVVLCSARRVSVCRGASDFRGGVTPPLSPLTLFSVVYRGFVTTKIAVYNRYVTGLGPAAGGLGRAKAAKPKGPPPGMRQQPNTSLTFWCFVRLCLYIKRMRYPRGMCPQRNLFCVATNLPSP